MKPRLIVVAAMATLALAACSSGTKSDTPAGDASSTPASTATTSETTTTANGAGAASSDFCASLAGIEAVSADVVADTNKLSAAISDSTKWEDPATVASLNEIGQAMLDEIPAVTNYFETASSQTKDPELAAALVSMGDLYGTYFKNWAQSAVDATDVMSFAMGFLDLTSSAEMSGVMTKATDAAYKVSGYAAANCS